MDYANGRLPDSALAWIPGTSHRVRADLLPQTVALLAAFRAHFGRPLGITDSYRTFLEQVVVKAKKPLLAATPGKSNHGWGTALDLGSGVNSFTSAEHAWMRANAPRFGWNLPGWARQDGSKPEAWHWEASGGVVPVSSYRSIPGAVPTVPTVSAPDPIAPAQEDPDMARLIRHPNGSIALVGPGPHMRVLHTVTEVEALRATGQATGETIQLPNPLIWNTCAGIAQRAGTYSA